MKNGDERFKKAVGELFELTENSEQTKRKNPQLHLPSAKKIIAVVEELKSVFYPGYYGQTDNGSLQNEFHIGASLDNALQTLEEQIRLGFCFVCDEASEKCDQARKQVDDLMASLLERLPEVKKLLDTDVQASFEGDPAATGHGEVIFCYPGFQAILHHRIAHELYKLNIPLIPRIINEHAHSLTGIDIHPGAQIGSSFFIDHGNGVVIGETSVVGSHVRIYQGVTLGAKSFPLDTNGNPIKGVARHPIIEDGVIIYSGATVLGRVTIGKQAVIGGNVWLTHSVPAGGRVSQAGLEKSTFSEGAGI
jgi:serine O-acetyltransferase